MEPSDFEAAAQLEETAAKQAQNGDLAGAAATVRELLTKFPQLPEEAAKDLEWNLAAAYAGTGSVQAGIDVLKYYSFPDAQIEEFRQAFAPKSPSTAG
jgi:hypothetical protein